MLDTATGRAKITDFGLARAAASASALTQEGAVPGTPAYMSPEQAQGTGDLDARSDVYSRGVTLYEALTGEVPFRGLPHLVLRQVIQDEPRPPRRLNDAVPRDLETVCVKAMAKEPGRRYATARDLADDLRRFVNAEPVRARPVGRVGRGWRWCRRNPIIAGLAAALVLVFLGGFAGVLWQWGRAEANAQEAGANFRQAKANAQEADRNFRQARKVVDTFFGRVYREGLLSQPGTQELQKKVLQDVRGYYEEFVRQRQSDPGLRAELADAYFNIGLITSQIGDKAEARASFQKALPLYQALNRENAAAEEFQNRLVECLDLIGQMYESTAQPAEALRAHQEKLDLLERLSRANPGNGWLRANQVVFLGNMANFQLGLGRTNDARRSYDRVREILKRLVRDHPTDNSFKYQLAHTYNNLGVLLGGPEPRRSLRYHQQARALREELLQASPGNPRYLRNLARSVRFIAEHHKSQGKHAEALATFQDAATLLREASKREPAVTLYRSDLGELQLTQGDLHRRCGQHAQAVSTFQEACGIFEKLAAVSPNDTTFRIFLAAAYDGLAAVHKDQGELDKALKGYQQVLTIVKKSVEIFPQAERFPRDVAETYGELAALQRRRGRPAEAAALALERKKLFPKDPKELFTVACDLARCLPLVGQGKAELTPAEQAERRCYADLAVRALEEAVGHGYQDGQRLRRDSSLAPLRGREDFRQLLHRLKAQGKTKGD
jgi:serine/threonine-protein kinase